MHAFNNGNVNIGHTKNLQAKCKSFTFLRQSHRPVMGSKCKWTHFEYSTNLLIFYSELVAAGILAKYEDHNLTGLQILVLTCTDTVLTILPIPAFTLTHSILLPLLTSLQATPPASVELTNATKTIPCYLILVISLVM